MWAMTFLSPRPTVLRPIAALPLTLALVGSAWAVPVKGAGAPFQADLPAGWTQQVSTMSGAQVLRVTAPGTPPPVALVFFFAPYKSTGNDAKTLTEFIGGVEEGASGGGQGVLKRLSERPLTVGGVRGIERQYTLTIKASGSVIRTQAWYGATSQNLVQFQGVIGAKATPAQTAIFDKVLSTVKFK